MDAVHLLHTRYSASNRGGPTPSPEMARNPLESAAHVPGHGRLLPWRLLVVEGDARTRLSDVTAEALARRMPLANEQSLARKREKALRAPLTPDDPIVGFIHVGTDVGTPKPRPRPSPDQSVSHWTGAVPT